MIKFIFLALAFLATCQAQWVLTQPDQMQRVSLHVRADTAMADSLHIITPDRTIEIVAVKVYTQVPVLWAGSMSVGRSGWQAAPDALGVLTLSDQPANSVATIWTGEYQIRVADDAPAQRSIYLYFHDISATGTGIMRVDVLYREYP